MRTDFPQYDPPYDSPLEDVFAWSLSKYVARDVTIFRQFEVPTACGKFRIDFVAVTPNGYRVAFECDGADFHEDSRDEWRDAMILGSGQVDSIIRLRGQDIFHRVNDVLLVASRWHPRIFSERAFHNLTCLASNRALMYDVSDDPFTAVISYPDESKVASSPLHIRLFRRMRVNPSGVRRQFWQCAFRFATSNGGGNLDEVIREYRNRVWSSP